METKKCSKCGRELPLSKFNKNKNRRDGLQDRCRDCFSAYNRIRYRNMREKVKADVRRYKEENPQKVFETRLATCKKSPTKKNAYYVVDAAIKAGVIERPHVCSGCGCSDEEHRIEAHHHDYSRPLDVIWLCTPCHRRMDARRREREGKKPYGGTGHGPRLRKA